MLFGFFDRLRDILPLADTIVEDIGLEDLKVLEKSLAHMFEVMQKVAKFSCEYVKRSRAGRPSSLEIWPMLMIAERIKDAFINAKDKETIKELDQELTKIIEKLKRAVDVETLSLTRKIGRS